MLDQGCTYLDSEEGCKLWISQDLALPSFNLGAFFRAVLVGMIWIGISAAAVLGSDQTLIPQEGNGLADCPAACPEFGG